MLASQRIEQHLLDHARDWQMQIGQDTRRGYTDLNKASENLVAQLLNSAWGHRFVNANREKKDQPGIDLVDKQAGVGVQVTTTADLKKVRHTLKMWNKHGLGKRCPNGLRHVVLSPDEPGKPREPLPVISPPFDLKEDVYTLERIITDAVEEFHPDNLERLQDIDRILAAGLERSMWNWAGEGLPSVGRCFHASVAMRHCSPSDGFTSVMFEPLVSVESAPRSSADAYEWAFERGAADAGATDMLVVLEGLPGGTTTILDVRARIVPADLPEPTYYIQGHYGGADDTIGISFDLDDDIPVAKGLGEDEPYFNGRKVITLTGLESCALRVVARVQNKDRAWVLDIRAERGGRPYSTTLDLGNGRPFMTFTESHRVPWALASWDGSCRYRVKGPDGSLLMRAGYNPEIAAALGLNHED